MFMEYTVFTGDEIFHAHWLSKIIKIKIDEFFLWKIAYCFYERLQDERLRNLSKLKNPAIFHRNNTQSFIERIPFFRRDRLTKIFQT